MARNYCSRTNNNRENEEIASRGDIIEIEDRKP